MISFEAGPEQKLITSLWFQDKEVLGLDVINTKQYKK